MRHRASRLGQAESTYLPLEIIDDHEDKVSTTYRAGYELIMRRFRVMLQMLEIHQERGGAVGSFEVSARPTVTSRVSYLSEAFEPHLLGIGSLEDFAKYAPYREDRDFALSVHPDDLEGAYQVLRESEIRLSVIRHPDQHWWREDNGTDPPSNPERISHS